VEINEGTALNEKTAQPAAAEAPQIPTLTLTADDEFGFRAMVFLLQHCGYGCGMSALLGPVDGDTICSMLRKKVREAELWREAKGR
jgi:hypothetical protein